MGLVHAYKKGEVPASKVSQAVKDAAKSMKKSSVKKYAKTKHDDLPKKVKEERDYKDEYKKFQSSTKSKKYRAELNKYNRKKGTYGNGDGKDASHKGGKIVGFESQSTNRGRAEKSRLKKENLMNKLNEAPNYDLDGMKKFIDNSLKRAGIKVLKFDPMKKSFTSGIWGGFYTVKSNNKTDMPGQGKVKRGSAVLPFYIDKDGKIDLGVSSKKFIIGVVGDESRVIKNLKSFKKSDLDEGYSMRDLGLSPFFKKLNPMQRQAVSIALVMGGNMTGAVKAIEKIKKGLSKDKKVKNALKLANESVKEGIGDMMSKKLSKHKGTRNKAEVGNILKYLMKKGDNKKDALDKIKQNYDYVSKKYRSASVSKKADILTSLQESIVEGIFGKFDTGAAFKGNGMTVYDRNQEKAGDYKDIAHIGEDGKITIYDRKVKKEPKLMQSLNKISQEFKKTFKESVNENNMAHVYSKDLNTKKFKDLGLYLSNVLDLAPNKDFRLTTNKKLLAINIDKINPKSLQNIKKRFGIDLKQKAKEPIRLKSKSGMGKISHLGMESVNEAAMELNKIKDAILMFQKKIKKQGRVTNARDEEHLSNLIKLYIKMGGKGVKEGLGDKFSKKLSKFNKKNQKSRDAMKKYAKLKKKESVDEARGTCWVGYQQKGMKDKGGKMVPNCVKEITEIFYEVDGKGYGYTLEYINDGKLNEAEYQGRKVKLGKPMQGDTKKFKVYVKNPKGNVVKVNFGQGGKAKGGTMKIRKSNPKARKSFRARHNCDNPGPRHKARYWSCRKW